MPTRREFLIGKGLAQPGRGRFSLDAQNELDNARNEGVVFDDEKGGGETTSVSP